jgi:ubiquinone/menaquinone biosynthesis C-methylase UbiE
MRAAGLNFLEQKIKFLNGSAEKTGLQGNSFDLVTMASSFHWPKTSEALQEFDRILSPNGVFSALWNPRLTDRSESEREVERLLSIKYNITSRTSSGLSGITVGLSEILKTCGIFRSIAYAEAIDVVQRSHEEYIGAWRSVNDIQSQLGKGKFSEFIDDVERAISKYSTVEVHYLTRAWIACK